MNLDSVVVSKNLSAFPNSVVNEVLNSDLLGEILLATCLKNKAKIICYEKC